MKKFIKADFKYSKIIDATIETRQIALKYFKKDVAFDNKKDDSPVTKADLEINSLLNSTLKKLYPNHAILSEENDAAFNVTSVDADKVFIIDPLDGTSSFIKGSKEFSVNVALKIADELVMGIIYSPIDDILYYAEGSRLFKIIDATQNEAQILQITPQTFHKKQLVKVIATRREDELQLIRKELESEGLNFELISFSSSLKFCYLAEGEADFYYRMASISLWDVAAGFAIVKAAGFSIIDYDKNDFIKNILSSEGLKILQKNNFRIPPFIVRLL
jgi:3'(2'), 5'-bisphosphate nucleotidase